MTKLYSILSQSASPPSFRLSLNPDSEIYRAHFPDAPITPGACIADICQDLLQLHMERHIALASMTDTKFLQPVLPSMREIRVDFDITDRDEFDFRVRATVLHDDTELARLSMCFRWVHHVCVVIPSYNNAETVCNIVTRSRAQLPDVIVVNDGSTDDTLARLRAMEQPPLILSFDTNRGKGAALKAGILKARQLGFTHVVTLDSDGQHYPEDIPVLIGKHLEYPTAVIVGNRGLDHENMSLGSRFANHFSNFWFAFQTWQYLPDTQCGFRLYPIGELHGTSLLTSRYEAELEVMVFSAWACTQVIPVPVRVWYPPREERVSHFRPAGDFGRIFALNTCLTFASFVYGWPRIILTWLWRFVTTVLVLLIDLFILFGISIPYTWWHFRGGRDNDLARRDSFHSFANGVFRWGIWSLPNVSVRIKDPDRIMDFINTTSRGAIIIGNHQSTLDMLAAISFSRRIVGMANDNNWNSPAFAYAMHHADFVPASGGIENNEKAVGDILDRGYSLVIFPEGTRSVNGRVGRFHRGAFHLAETLNVPIIPMRVYGAQSILPKNAKVLCPGRLTFVFGPMLRPDDVSMGQTSRERMHTYRRWFADRIEKC